MQRLGVVLPPMCCRLHWPEGATNKKSVKSVKRMLRLRRLVLEQADVTAWPIVDLLCDLLQSLFRSVVLVSLSGHQALLAQGH